MYIQEIGVENGPTIVFLHGGGISGWIWRKQVEYFKKDFHCIIPDLPGHGKSEEPLISLQDCALKVADLIERRRNSKIIVVGHSLGAKVAVELLNIKPDIIDRAVIVSALYRPTKAMLWLHKPWVYKLTVSLVRFKKILELQALVMKLREKTEQQNFMKDIQRLNAVDLQKIYEIVYKTDLPSGFTNLGAKVLVMAGLKEPEAMRQSVRDLVSVIPQAKGILVRGVDHTFPWAEADLFNKIIRQWVLDIPLESDYILEV